MNLRKYIEINSEDQFIKSGAGFNKINLETSKSTVGSNPPQYMSRGTGKVFL